MANTDILYIEDNFHNRRIVRKILERQGYRLHEREDGLDGYETLKEMKPGIVLLDISLPTMDGMEIAGMVKADPELEHIFLIALTASAMQGDRERFLEGGCDDYLSKPFRALDLVDMVGKYMARIEGDISVPVSPPQPAERHENGIFASEETEPAPVVPAEAPVVPAGEEADPEPELIPEAVEIPPIVPAEEVIPAKEIAEPAVSKEPQTSVEAASEIDLERVEPDAESSEVRGTQLANPTEVSLPADKPESVWVAEKDAVEVAPQVIKEAKVSFEKALEDKLVFEDLEPASVVVSGEPKSNPSSVDLIKAGILGTINRENLKPVDPNA